MPRSTDLKAILDRLLADTASAKDRQAVKRGMANGKIVFAKGSRNVAAGRIENAIIVIGNENQFKVEASEAAYELLRERLFSKPSDTAEALAASKTKLGAVAFLPWLFIAIALSLITEVARRFLGGDGAWPDTAAAIFQGLSITLAVIGAALVVTTLFLPAHSAPAKAVGSRALKRFKSKEAILITGIALGIALGLRLSLPWFARLYNVRGAQFQSREPPGLAAAIEWYKRALRLNPSFALAHYNLASAYEESNPEGAIEEYRLAIRYDGNFCPAYTKLAGLYNDRALQYHEQGRLSPALELYKQAVTLDPGYAKAHYNLAAAYEDLHELSEAIEEYRAAIRYDSHLFRAYNNLARLYLSTSKNKQDYESALDLLCDALSLSPQDEEVQYSLYKNLGWANYELGYADLAEENLKRAIRLRGDKAAAHCLFAYMLKRSGRRRQAAGECYDCVSQSYAERDVENKWLSDAQQSFKKGECNATK